MTRAALGWTIALACVVPAPVAEAQEAPPPTPVPPYGSPSPYPSVLQTPGGPSRRPAGRELEAAALAGLDGGDVLFEIRAGARRPVASVTKIMTALLVLEHSAPTDIVVASEAAAAQEGAVLGLVPGERRPVAELLYALMLQSSNDVAVALAEHVAGSVGAFVKRMNRRARELGARDTRFRSPNGLDDRGHSTARDLVTITRAAFEHETFSEVVSTRARSIPAPNGLDRTVQNRNALLWLYPDAIGVKTGYTAAAGFCLVAAAERDGLRLVAVVLGGQDEVFSEAAGLLEHGFAAYEERELLVSGDPLEPLTVSGVAVRVEAAADVSQVVPSGRGGAVHVEVRPSPGLALPIRAGDEVGEAIVTVDGEEAARVAVVAAADVHAPPPPPPPGSAEEDPIAAPVAAVLGAVLALAL